MTKNDSSNERPRLYVFKIPEEATMQSDDKPSEQN